MVASWTWLGIGLLAGLMLSAESCSGPGGGAHVVPRVGMATVRSVSPGSISAPPMARTAILPSSAMTSIRRPMSGPPPAGWTQLPGGAISVAASPDGSIWVLSSQGTGADRSIWHYANGGWTNIPGAATRLAVAPDGTLWAVNSAGGIYCYNGIAWSTIAGGASDISVASDGSVFVVSNQGGGPYGRGLWRYASGWSQVPGAARRVAASWDGGTYPGNILPGGIWTVDAQDSPYYYNPAAGYAQIPGGVVQIAPTKNGGLFALGHVANPDGSYPIYYDDLGTGNWTLQPGSAISIGTDSVHTYMISAGGGIYSSVAAPQAPPTPSPTPAPTPTPVPTPGPTSPPASVVASAPSLAFLSVGSGFAQTDTVSQAGYGGSYSLSNMDPTIASATIAGNAVTVTPVAAGLTTLRVTGGNGGFVDIPISVTVSQFTFH